MVFKITIRKKTDTIMHLKTFSVLVPKSFLLFKSKSKIEKYHTFLNQLIHNRQKQIYYIYHY